MSEPPRNIDEIRRAYLEASMRKGRFRSFPRLSIGAFRLAWSASPLLVTVAGIASAVSGLISGGIVLAGRSVLSATTDGGASIVTRPTAPAVMGVVALSAVGMAVGMFNGHQRRLLAELVERRSFATLLDVTTKVDLVTFEQPDFYDRVKRVETDFIRQPSTATEAIFSLVAGAIGIAALIVSIMLLDPLLPVLVIGGFVPVLAIGMVAGRRFAAFRLSETTETRRRDYLRATLTGRPQAPEIRAFGIGDLLRERYERYYDTYIARLRRHLRVQVALQVLVMLVTIALVAVWIGGAWLMLRNGRITGAEFGAAVVAMPLLAFRGGTLSGAFQSLNIAAIFLEDFEELKRLADQLPQATASDGVVQVFETLEAEGLAFTYPGASVPALHDVSFTFRRGEVIALVGENGSGKTTLAKILAGLYRPDEGRVLWDGRDIDGLDADAVRGNVAVIFQDFVRYELSARDNVGLGDPSRLEDVAAVTAAAESAGADAYLRALPDGYDTILSKAFGGAELSTGQWQRVALARAFIRDSPFVILDEPTASLDARAEHELFEAMRSLLAGRTVLLISHRFTSVRSADRILVLRHGSLVEEGTHDELIAIRGLYAELFELQASKYVDTTQ